MISDIEVVAASVKSIAREELLPRFGRAECRYKDDGSVVTEADLAVQRRLTEVLATVAPGVPLLGEEMPASTQRALLDRNRQGLWCLDPLDGTSNFVSGIPFFAVSLALLGPQGPEFGLVYDPTRDECFRAIAGQGAWLNGVRLPSAPSGMPLSRCIAIVDTKRLGAFAGKVVVNPPYRSQRSFGSSALEWCWLAARRGQIYVHGRQNVWDYAAGLLILQEAGGRASRLDGRTDFGTDIAPCSVVAAADGVLYEQTWQWLNTLGAA